MKHRLCTHLHATYCTETYQPSSWRPLQLDSRCRNLWSVIFSLLLLLPSAARHFCICHRHNAKRCAASRVAPFAQQSATCSLSPCTVKLRCTGSIAQACRSRSLCPPCATTRSFAFHEVKCCRTVSAQEKIVPVEHAHIFAPRMSRDDSFARATHQCHQLGFTRIQTYQVVSWKKRTRDTTCLQCLLPLTQTALPE